MKVNPNLSITTDSKEIIIKPIVTEKSNANVQEGKYTFKVAKKATKVTFDKELFKKEVESHKGFHLQI